MNGYEIYAKIRDRKGLKDSHIANAAGIPASTFSDWKKDKSKPKAEKMQKIADVLEVPVNYLLTGDPKYLYLAIKEELEPTLTLEETKIINAYRKADDIDKQMILRILHLELGSDSESLREA